MIILILPNGLKAEFEEQLKEEEKLNQRISKNLSTIAYEK